MCDGRLDCADKSDEFDCKMVQMDSSYMPSMPPGSTKKDSMNNSRLKVNVSLTMKSIHDINEVNSILEIPFRLHLSWIDPRISLVNIRNGTNILSAEQMSSLWLPVLSLPNTKDELSISFNDETSVGFVTCLKNAKGTRAPLDILRNDITYKGEEW